MKRVLRGKKLIYAIAAILLAIMVILLGHGYQAIREARQSLETVKQSAASHSTIAITTRTFSLAPDPGEKVWTGPAEYRDICEFDQKLYAATSAGLVVLAENGKQLEQWTTADGLPSLDLTAVVVLQGDLWIGTADSGLLRLHQKSWIQYLPQNPANRSITALLPTPQGNLFIGTRSGLLRYDRETFSPFFPQTLGRLPITRLAADTDRLFIGTYQNGVFIAQSGTLQHFDKEQGLGDSMVTDLNPSAEGFFVSTPSGIQEWNGRFLPIVKDIFVTSFSVQPPSNIVAATYNTGIVSITPRSIKIQQSSVKPMVLKRAGNTLLAFEGKQSFYLDLHQRWKPWAQSTASLSDSNISTILRTASGELWIGYFDRGVEVLNSQMQRIWQIQDDTFFCINSFSQDARGRVYVSTANGLAIIERDKSMHIYREADGLLSDRVMQALPLDPDGNRVAIATAQGFTLKEGPLMKSIYAFHGLVNNHVYSLAVNGDQIYAGTLGGISQITKMQVIASWSQMDSGLTKNWVNALLPIGDKLLIGTYGGGIQARTASGDWIRFESLPKDLEINPNALFSDGQYVFCGTLDRGFFIYNIKQNSWKQYTNDLPGKNVTSFSTDGTYLYAATDHGLLQLKYDKISTIPDLH